MNLIRSTHEVFRCADSPVLLDRNVVEVLLAAARLSPLRRARVCMHRDDRDALHEMLVVVLRESYIRPHKHLGKAESFHLLHGAAGVLCYDDLGHPTRQWSMDCRADNLPFFYRLEPAVFHSQVVLSDYIAFHECTQGPFRRDDTVFADWAPVESSPEARVFLNDLARKFNSDKPHE